ncbi:MAG: hypothetical protein CTY20_06260 [Hyphomicrobium sp.]|nr:MAG: hypothetical protein CTY20_06260 [Hyphomicrobium sp.]
MGRLASSMDIEPEPDWWLGLVEVGKPDSGILYAEEVEGAYAWAAAEARCADEAAILIRSHFSADNLVVAGFECLFSADFAEILHYDGRLAATLQGKPRGHRVARGALHYFAAEAEA